MTIWKYDIPIEDYFELDMPSGARPLHVAMQGSQPCLWALVAPEEAGNRKHRFRLAGTGHSIERDQATAYVGTFQMGPFVWHVFHLGEKPLGTS